MQNADEGRHSERTADAVSRQGNVNRNGVACGWCHDQPGNRLTPQGSHEATERHGAHDCATEQGSNPLAALRRKSIEWRALVGLRGQWANPRPLPNRSFLVQPGRHVDFPQHPKATIVPVSPAQKCRKSLSCLTGSIFVSGQQ
eukprot:5217490-Prymnesium_polylepis.1